MKVVKNQMFYGGIVYELKYGLCKFQEYHSCVNSFLFRASGAIKNIAV